MIHLYNWTPRFDLIYQIIVLAFVKLSYFTIGPKFWVTRTQFTNSPFDLSDYMRVSSETTSSSTYSINWHTLDRPTLTETEKEIKQLESSLFASNFYYTNTSNSRATFKFWRFCDVFLKFLCFFITIWNVSSCFYKLVVELLKSDFFSICTETVNSGTWSQPVLNERITETIHSYSNYWELSRAENSSVDSVA